MVDLQDLTVRVAGWIDTSLVDVLGHPSFTIWFNYCNFRCPWCQNAHVVTGSESKEVTVGRIIGEIGRASIVVDYVQATGGEPTLQSEGLAALFELSKDEARVRTSLSTNGSRSDIVKSLIENGLLDHIAIDVKAPIGNPEKYGVLTGVRGRKIEAAINEIRSSIDLSMEVPFTEFRTTFVPSLLSEDDVIETAAGVKDHIKDDANTAYVVQQFVPSETMMDPDLASRERTPLGVLMETARKVKCEVGLRNVYVRTQEIGTAKI